MIQCIMCEDWFHGRHLMLNENKVVPSDTAYSEMVCQGCVKKNEFLMAYQGQAVRVMEKEAKGDGKGKSSATSEPKIDVESNGGEAAAQGKQEEKKGWLDFW